MIADEFIIREATGADMPGIARVRTSVRENLLTTEQLARRGITNASVAASLLENRKGWLAERRGEVVAFSMADRGTRRSSPCSYCRNARGAGSATVCWTWRCNGYGTAARSWPG